MRVKSNLSLCQLKKNVFLLKHNTNKSVDNQIITFNSTAAFLWMKLHESDFSIEDVEKLLIQKYAIDSVNAKDDAEYIISMWKRSSLII